MTPDEMNYDEAMKSPVRPPSLLSIEITDRNEAPGAINPHPATIILTFNSSDIIESKESWDVDPFSRKLPHHTFTFKVWDYNSQYLDKYPWESRKCRATVVYDQILLNGSSYMVRQSIFVIYKVTTSNHMTQFQCEDLMPLLNETSYQVGADGKLLLTTDEVMKNIADQISTEGSGGLMGVKLLNEGLTEKLRIVDKFYGQRMSDIIQKLANSQGKTIFLSHSPYDFDNLGNDWFIRFTDPEVRKFPTSNSRRLRIEDVLDKGITHILAPKVNRLKSVGRDTFVAVNDSPCTNEPVKVSNDRDPGNWSKVSFEGLYQDAKLQSLASSPGVDEIRNVTLEGCEAHWTLDSIAKPYANFVGKKVDVSESYSVLFADDSGGVELELNNPYMNMDQVLSNIVNDFYRYINYRHTLKIRYRGDPNLTPFEKIWFDYAPGKSVPCMILSNTICFNGSISGEIILKIMLTDKEMPSVKLGTLEPYVNTRISQDGIVHQIKADTNLEPYFCAFAYDAQQNVISHLFDHSGKNLNLGKHELVLDLFDKGGSVEKIVYGVYGKQSSLVLRKLSIPSDSKKLKISLTVLDNKQGQICWSNDTVVVE